MERNGEPITVQQREGVNFTGVNYAGMVPHLTKAIQEQQAMIEALQQELEVLEQRIEELESK